MNCGSAGWLSDPKQHIFAIDRISNRVEKTLSWASSFAISQDTPFSIAQVIAARSPEQSNRSGSVHFPPVLLELAIMHFAFESEQNSRNPIPSQLMRREAYYAQAVHLFPHMLAPSARGDPTFLHERP
ncbi:hypothetical protein MUK42_11974 [Musa troglodytarum]|uniref:Uncharacterized protein n=1 Tax=Musa troglodytarum TaxID=320322 RepID=A0A9E7H955_9LILI|nr:hypothetical protein MUK42_11974 [Musa troglodytarum]